uniref:Uncharacterized protein n=1 Tax=Acrobeloides nanus TaxID=290746 RepID=A0A914C3H6_9BILA
MCHRFSFLSLLFLYGLLVNCVYAGFLDNIGDVLKGQNASNKLLDGLDENLKQIITNITSKVVDAAHIAVITIQNDALKAVGQIKDASNSTVERLKDELKTSLTQIIEAAETAAANNKQVQSALRKFDYFLIMEVVFMVIVISYIIVQFYLVFKQSRCCGLCGSNEGEKRYSEKDMAKEKGLETEELGIKKGDVFL